MARTEGGEGFVPPVPPAVPPPTPSQAGEPERIGVLTILSDPAVRIIILVVFVVILGFGLILPILPLYARSFGVGTAAASLLISSFAAARLLFDLFAGPIVDRFGERATATAGLIVVSASALGAGLAPNYPLLVLLRSAGGGGSSVLFAALYSYLLKVVPKARMARTLGLFYGSFNVGVFAGAPIGGLIAHVWGLRSPLFFYAAMCLLGAALFQRYVSDPDAAPAVRGESPSRPRSETLMGGSIGRIRALLADRTFVAVIVVNMAYFWVVAGVYDTLVPLFGQERLGMSPLGIGVVLGVAIVTEFLVLYPSGSLADRVGRKIVLVPSMVAMGVMIAAVGFSGSPIMLGVALALLGVTTGVSAVPPGAMLADVAPPEGSASAVSMFRFCGDLGFVLGPLVGGVTAGAAGFRTAFIVSAVPVVVALALLLPVPETLHSRSGPGV